MKRFFIILAVLAAILPVGTAHAGITVESPSGPVTADGGPTAVVSTQATYTTSTDELGNVIQVERVMLGDGGSLGVNTVPATDCAGGEIDVMDSFDGVLARAYMPAVAYGDPHYATNQTLLAGKYANPKAGGLPSDVVATWADGLQIVLVDYATTTVTVDPNGGGFIVACNGPATQTVLGTINPAVYTPVVAVTGDPWFHFRSDYRADSHLVFKNRAGRTVRRIDWGWLAAGKHRIHFGCGKLNGTYHVHVHGVATDKATQNSPTAKVVC